MCLEMMSSMASRVVDDTLNNFSLCTCSQPKQARMLVDGEVRKHVDFLNSQENRQEVPRVPSPRHGISKIRPKQQAKKVTKLIMNFQAENQPELQPQETILVNQEQDKPLVDRKGMEESVMVRPEARKVVIGGRRIKNFKRKREKIVVRRIVDLFATTESPVFNGGVNSKRKVPRKQDMSMNDVAKRQRKK